MSLGDNIESVRKRIAAACVKSGRNPDGITLLAVTKNQPAAVVAEAVSLGLQIFGENRVQEAKLKIPASPNRAHWHFIGHLQSNKARDAVALFEAIESVDSLELAAELERQADKRGKTIQILAEVNVVGEASKFGWNPTKLANEIVALGSFRHLELHGMMTVAPYARNPETVRPVFKRLRELRDRCSELLGAPLPTLSMGMSGDFEVAIEEGSTLVRIGTGLFGARPKPVALCEESSP
jgi:pyridoxal phosphate enzyme (YggS family)